MATNEIIQAPVITKLEAGTFHIKHPDISGYARTEMTAPLTAAGTALTVADNNNFEDNDWFILGEIGDAKTEECDINGAITRGTSITITNTTKFSHEIHTPVIKIYARKFKIYGSATDGGTGTVIGSISATGKDITWDKPDTEWTLVTTDTTYAFYYATFYDGTTESSASDYIASTGLAYTSVEKLVEGGLNLVNATIDNEMITKEWLLTVANDFQDEVTNYLTDNGISKDWSFEIFSDDTSLSLTENENKYALSGLASDLKYTDSKDSIINVKVGSKLLDYQDLDEFEKGQENATRTEVKTAITAADTSIVLDDTYEFAEAGVVYIGADTITYTGNTETTGTLTGCTDVDSDHAVDASVWQGVSPAEPTKYTIFNEYIYLNYPVLTAYVGYKLKFKGLKKLTRLTAFSSITVIPFTYLAKYYIGYRIESRKGNGTQADRLLKLFNDHLEKQAHKDGTMTTDTMNYYNYHFTQ